MKHIFFGNSPGRTWVNALVFLPLLCAFLFPASARAEQRTARIVRVVDGDTVVTDDKATLRLVGIDTPELGSRSRPGMPFARAAKAALEKLIKGRRVEIELAEESRDRHGRLLAYIHLQGRLINLEMVEQGLARVYILGPNTRYGADLIEAERRARRAKKGLWENWRGRWGR